jgi:excisionase family DNA binding protein
MGTKPLSAAESVQKPLTLKEAAVFLGLKPSYVYNLVHFGKLSAYKPGGKILFFKQEELERYAFRNKKVSDDELAEQAERILLAGNTRKHHEP